MSDTTQTLQLPGAELKSIDRNGDDSITLHFSKVFLVQDMEGAIEDSLWTQAVTLTIRDIEINGELPDCPCEISGGDLTNNIYTYRDHAPLPIDWRGEVFFKLAIAGKEESVMISGASMQLEQIDHPRYIKHTKK
jgi:hypothetical protein